VSVDDIQCACDGDDAEAIELEWDEAEEILRRGQPRDWAPVDKQILALALPSLCSLLMDPLASLVDSVYVGQLGAAR
jgi:Na+-driven multidrug efflux pump